MILNDEQKTRRKLHNKFQRPTDTTTKLTTRVAAHITLACRKTESNFQSHVITQSLICKTYTFTGAIPVLP